MEYRIEAYIVCWQNKFNGGKPSPCSGCGFTIYLNKLESYDGICPSCGKLKKVTTESIIDSVGLSDGGVAGNGKRKIYKRHLITFLFWWGISAIVGMFVFGFYGAILSILFNFLMTSIGFRAFTYEIENEKF